MSEEELDTKRPRQVLTPEQIAKRNQRIVEAVRSGVPLKDMRGRFGMGEESIKRILADMGVPVPKPGSGRRWA